MMLNPEFPDPTLRDQFQRIQEHQNERYKHRKTSKSDDKLNGGVNQVCSVNIETPRLSEDDLGLRTATKEIETIVVRGPATVHGETLADTRELDFLHRQVARVEQLQLENTQMNTSLKRKEHDLSELQRIREEEKVALGGGSSATQRIVELSKKNREITAELTTEKNRVRQLQRKLKEAETAEKSASEPGKRTPRSVGAQQKELHSGATGRSESEYVLTVSQLQEQLLQAKQKGTDYRNQCQLLKQDLKVAHKVLVKEVGEGVSVSALLSGVSGWRGRAQQIIVLQNKVAELKQQLERAQSDGSRQMVKSGGEADIRQKAAIQRIETERKRNLEETLLELESLKSEYAKVQQQYNALRARNKTLTSDVKSLRSQLSTTLKKTVDSDEQIQAQGLTRGGSMSTTSSGREETRLQEWEHERDALQHTNHSLQTQLNKCLVQLQSLRETTPETSSKVRPSSSKSLEPYNGPKVCANSPKLSLPPLVPPPSGGNRKPHRPSTRTLMRKSLSAGQPSTQQLDSNLIEAHTIAQVSQTERDRLLELTGTLQQRLDATTDRLVRLETEVRNQRRHDVKPEKHLRSGLSSNSRGSKHQGGSKLETEVGRKPSAMELERKLALQLDENAVLKETLELTRNEKMEDVMLFHGMLQEAEKLFVDSLQKLQSE